MSVVHLRAPRRPNDEGGFTIIEVLVALTLIAIMMVSVAGVFYSGMRTAGETGHRTAAAAVATRELEGIRAIPYDKVGFYADQADYRATSPDGHATVKLANTTPSTVTPLVTPTGTDTVGSLSYSFRRDIVWIDAQGPNGSSTATTFTQAYKRATIEVTWTNDTGTHKATQESIIYPGGQSVYSGPGSGATSTTTTTAAAGAPVAPQITAVTVPPAPAGENQIDIAWSQSGTVSSFVVQWSTNSAFPSTGGVASSVPLSAATTSYQITGLSSGMTYHIRVKSYSSSGAESGWSPPVSEQTRTGTATTCTVVSLTVSEAESPFRTTKTYLANNGKMTTNLNLAVATSGPCTGAFSVRVMLGTTNLGSYPLTQSGSNYGGVVASDGTSAPVGTYNFDVLRNSTPVSGTQKAFLVCANTSSPSTNANAC